MSMEAISMFGYLVAAVASALAVDWFMRGLGERRLRRAVLDEAESYLLKSKRI